MTIALKSVKSVHKVASLVPLQTTALNVHLDTTSTQTLYPMSPIVSTSVVQKVSGQTIRLEVAYSAVQDVKCA